MGEIEHTRKDEGSVRFITFHSPDLQQTSVREIMDIINGSRLENGIIALNLSNISRIDSLVIGSLLETAQDLKKIGSNLVLFNVSPVVSTVFRLIRLEQLLDIVETENDVRHLALRV